nr:pilus assembly protein N-terminal domain-containing protein [Capnocytophaga leadbetteri]
MVLKENNAAIYVTGVEVGTTTIVVTDNYTKQTKEIGVKVTAAKQGGNNGNNNGGGKGGNNGGGKKK